MSVEDERGYDEQVIDWNGGYKAVMAARERAAQTVLAYKHNNHVNDLLAVMMAETVPSKVTNKDTTINIERAIEA